MEVWKDIPGYEGLYQISSYGRCRGLTRYVKHRNTTMRVDGRVLVPKINKRGYYKVELCKEGKQKTREIHQLVAIAFLGHSPCGFSVVVDHVDNDKTNNNAKNLKLISNRENSSQEHLLSKSKCVGVVVRGNKFESNIRNGKRRIYLGRFDTEGEASMYYQNAVKAIEENKPIVLKIASS